MYAGAGGDMEKQAVKNYPPDQYIGALIARVESLENLERRIDDKLTTLQETISEIQVTLAAAKGSWRALVGIGSAIAAIAGAVGAFVHKFMGAQS